MIEMHKVIIDGKIYVPLQDMIDDVRQHLDFEKEDIDFDDVYGYEIAEQEILCRLNMYMKGAKNEADN